MIMVLIFVPLTAGAFFLDLFKAKVPGDKVSPKSNCKSDGDIAADLFKKAKTLATEGRYADAIIDITDAIARNPVDAVLYFERGCLYYYLMLSETQATTHTETSLPPEDRILQPEPGEPSINILPATPADLCSHALADFDKAIALKANYDVFYYMRGVLFSSDICPEQDLWKAIADYDRALGINAKNAVYHLERGLVWAKLRQYWEAISNIDRAIGMEPANYYFRYEKGLIQEKMGLFSQAAASYKTVLELAPPERLAGFSRDLNRSRKGNCRDLIVDYTELIKKQPAFSTFYLQRAACYGDLKKYSLAVQDVTTALALQNDRRDLYLMRGKLYDQWGKTDEALRDFEKACALNHPAACYYRKLLIEKRAPSEQWIYFWTSKKKKEYFYSSENISKEGQVTIAQVRIEPAKNMNGNSATTKKATGGRNRNGYLLESWEFICSRSEFRIATIKKFDGKNNIIASYIDYEKYFRPVVVSSVSGKLLEIVCKQTAEK
ncbi:MAG: tetratricopeptide repeat protein [Syntrophaceae bacterium]|nr:tetratricopeptide repeat protein [Syntrophaceae bacterium]